MMKTLNIYNKLVPYPFGKKLFSFIVCLKAPYFKSVYPLINELQPNLCEVNIKKRRSVLNHLKTVYAIAMCNIAELAAGMMTEVSVPATIRWIPKKMHVLYLKKAKSNVKAIAKGNDIDWSQPGDVTVHVDVFDDNGETVFTADIGMNLKNK
jgi:acyl-coenzyme A thioesterase PaaI-like protein